MKSAVYPYMKLFELCPFPIACEKTNLFSPNLILSVSGFSPAMIGIILWKFFLNPAMLLG